MDRKFILMGLGFGLVGLLLGIVMGHSGNHSQFVTHAHIMLVGFLMSLVYGLIHKLWLNDSGSRMAVTQYYLHLGGSCVMFIGLFLIYGQYVEEATIGPIMGISTVIVLIALVLMKVMFIRAGKQA